MTDAETDLFYRDLIDTLLTSEGDHDADRLWLHDLVDSATTQFVVINGDSGAGKTHFLARFATERPRSLRYFLRSDSRQSLAYGDARTFLLRIGHQLAALVPDAFPEALDISAEQQIGTVAEGGSATAVRIGSLQVSPFRFTALRSRQRVEIVAGDLIGIDVAQIDADPDLLDVPTLERMALRTPAKNLENDHIVVLIDALDETRFTAGFSGGASVLDWLATAPALPGVFQFVIATRPDSAVLDRLRHSRAGDLTEIELSDHPGRCAADVEELVHATLTARGMDEGVDVGRMIQLVAARAAGNFQYATTVLRSGSSFTWEDANALPESLEELYAFYLTKIYEQARHAMVEVTDKAGEKGYLPAWRTVYQPLLGVLAVARAPLILDELQELSGSGFDLRDAIDLLSQFLRHDGRGHQLCHTSIASFLTSDYAAGLATLDCAVDADSWHRRLTDVLSQAEPLTSYARLHLAYHASRCGRLAGLVNDARFLSEAEPDGLVRFLSADLLSSGSAGQAYLAVYPIIRDLGTDERIPYLERSTREFGLNDLADQVAASFKWGHWSLRWTQVRRSGGYRQVLAPHLTPSAIAASWIAGQPAVVGAFEDPAEVRAYGTMNGQFLRGCPRPGKGSCTTMAMTSERGETLVAIGTSDGEVYLLNLDTARTVGGPWAQHGSAVLSIAIAYEGSSILIVSTDETGRAKALDAVEGRSVPSPAIEAIGPQDTSRYGVSTPATGSGPITLTQVGPDDDAITDGGIQFAFKDEAGNLLPTSREYHTQLAFVRFEGKLAIAWSASSSMTILADMLTGETLFGVNTNTFRPSALGVLRTSTGDCVLVISSSHQMLDLRLTPGPEYPIMAESHNFTACIEDALVKQVSLMEMDGRVFVVWLDSDASVLIHELGQPGQSTKAFGGRPSIGRIHYATVNSRRVVLAGESYGMIDGNRIRLPHGTQGKDGRLLAFDAHNGTLVGSLLTLSGGAGILDFTLIGTNDRTTAAISTFANQQVILHSFAGGMTRLDGIGSATTAMATTTVDSRQVLALAWHGAVGFFDPRTQELLQVVRTPENVFVVDIACTTIDSKMVLASTTWVSPMVTFQEVSDEGPILFERVGSIGGNVSALAISDDLLITGDTRGVVRIARIDDGALLAVIHASSRISGLSVVAEGLAVSTERGITVYNLHL
ncbi:ATP-binding protein [Micromonospora zamorensis]|uniref:ATP-binding protein n=1 Tax=Micromonospora zamorensis TaxID=709883 RepID=UPI002E17ED3F